MSEHIRVGVMRATVVALVVAVALGFRVQVVF
jgi:hypothetical protein